MKNKNKSCHLIQPALFAALIVALLAADASRVHVAAQVAEATPANVADLAALSAGALTLGEGAEGELTVESPEQWWAMPLSEGDVVFIAANARPGAELFPQLRVLSPEGVLLAQEDNPASSLNALIASLAAQQAGTYYVRVRGLHRSVGAYTVVVGRLSAAPEGQPRSASPTASPPPAPTDAHAPVNPTPTPRPTFEGDTLALGQVIEARLPLGASHTYTFEAPGGLPVVIEMTALQPGAAALDPYLELYGPGGYFLYENDDAVYGQMDARLVVTLPTTGVYTIVARSHGDRTGGAYNLSLRVGAMWRQ